MSLIIGIAASLLGGAALGYIAKQISSDRKTKNAQIQAEKLVADANLEAKDVILKAKEKAVRALSEIKKEEEIRRSQLDKTEGRLNRIEHQLERKDQELENEKKKITEKVRQIKEIKSELALIRNRQIKKLETIANLSRDEAKKIMLNLVEEDSKDLLVRKIKKMEQQGKEVLEAKARDIMAFAMQRYASSQVAESTTTTVSLPDDELKGRIIGREGRNINTIERLTGAEIIVDDTPEAIVVSAFDPVRREVARLTLQKLIEDGRIHPAKIEETVAMVKREIAKKIKEAGEAAIYDVGVAGIDEKLVKILGRLRFRTSYGQNVLIHAIEVAHLAGALANEIGLDATLARKAGLFHDIGKAVDHEIQGTHVEIGVNILKKFNIANDVIEAMRYHHEDCPEDNPVAALVGAADAISASRPGARKDTLENYLKRLRELEEIANSFEEVDRSYAIQAGREIRVFVNPENIDDLESIKLARNIADKIENDLKYPGEIKVCVIRETRAVDFAR